MNRIPSPRSTKLLLTCSTLAITLIFSACAHKTVVVETTDVAARSSAEDQKLLQEEEALFVERAVAQASVESALVREVVTALSHNPAKTEAFVTLAKQSLGTTEKLSASSLASRFNETSGRDFVVNAKRMHPELFAGRSAGMTRVNQSIETASKEIGEGKNMASPTHLSTNTALINDPRLLEEVTRFKQIDQPQIAGDVYHIRRRTEVYALGRKACDSIKAMTERAVQRSKDWVRLMRNTSDELKTAGVRNMKACFSRVAATRFVQFIGSAQAAQNLITQCGMAPDESLPFVKELAESNSTGGEDFHNFPECKI